VTLRYFVILVLLVSAPGIIGCSTRPPVAKLTLVSTRDAFRSATIIAPDVEGYYCYWRTVLDSLARFPWNQPWTDHALAIQAVMRKHPEANVMLQASVRVRVTSFLLVDRFCAVVKGDLARVE